MDSAIELLAAITALIIAVGGLLTVLLVQSRSARTEAQRTAAEIEAMRRDTKKTAEHVVNNHSDRNLRDDVDMVKAGQEQIMAGQAGLSASLRQLNRDMTQLRTELVTDRQARQQLDREAHEAHADLYAKIHMLSERIGHRLKRKRRWWG